MSVEGGSTEQVVFGTPRTSISIYWGSIDGDQGGNNNLNTFAITMDGYTLTGADLVNMGATGTGDQTGPLGNELVTITGLPAFTTATFSSTNNAFEFALRFCRSGALDLGDDDAWVCRTWLRRVPPEHKGQGVGDLIRFVEYMRRAAARRPFLLCGLAIVSSEQTRAVRRIRIPAEPPDQPDDAVGRRPPGRSVARAHDGRAAPCA